MAELGRSAARTSRQPMSNLAAVEVRHAALPTGSSPSVAVHAPAGLVERIKPQLAPYLELVPSRPAEIPRGAARVLVVPADAAEVGRLRRYGEAEAQVWIGVDAATRTITLATAADTAHLPVYVGRVVRSVLRLACAESAGQPLFLHGGMIASGGRGLAILGAKKSGKTSTILIAARAGADFVSNDDLSLHLAAGHWIGAGWPRSVSIRTDTLATLGFDDFATAHPELGSFSSARPDARLLTLRELATLIRGELTPSAGLAGLVFPSFVTGQQPVLDLLTPPEAARRLAGCLSPEIVKDSILTTAFGQPDPDLVGRAIERVAASVPAYSLKQGLEFIRTSAIELLRVLAGDTADPPRRSGTSP